MIATNHHVLMFLVEAALGVIGAIVITFALMAALFTWAGQANPPLADVAWQVLIPLAVVIAAWRGVLRFRAARPSH